MHLGVLHNEGHDTYAAMSCERIVINPTGSLPAAPGWAVPDVEICVDTDCPDDWAAAVKPTVSCIEIGEDSIVTPDNSACVCHKPSVW